MSTKGTYANSTFMQMPELAKLYFFVKMCGVGEWLKYGEIIFQTIYELTLCSHENKNMS